MPFGLDLPLGTRHGAGTVVLHEGLKMLEIPLWRSYFCRLHSAGHRSLYGHGPGLGLSCPG